MKEKEIFAALIKPSKKGILKAKPIKRGSRFYICKSGDGNINFLIKTKGKTDTSPYNLRYIDILHNQTYRIEENKKQKDIICTHIKCKSVYKNITNIFFEQIHNLSSLIKENDSDKLVGEKLDNLVEIFRSIDRKSIKTIRGLWAELFIIHASSDVNGLIEAWHQDDKDRYDFSSDVVNLEIKSRGKSKPIQAHFSMHQAHPPKGTKRVLICSVYVNSNSSGQSVFDLKDGISKRIKTRMAQEKLETNFYKILGANTTSDEVNLTFDIDIAASSCLLFDLDNIPKIPEDIPSEILDVSYKVDLTHIAQEKGAKLKKYPLLQKLKKVIN